MEIWVWINGAAAARKYLQFGGHALGLGRFVYFTLRWFSFVFGVKATVEVTSSFRVAPEPGCHGDRVL